MRKVQLEHVIRFEIPSQFYLIVEASSLYIRSQLLSARSVSRDRHVEQPPAISQEGQQPRQLKDSLLIVCKPANKKQSECISKWFALALWYGDAVGDVPRRHCGFGIPRKESLNNVLIRSCDTI